MYTGEMHTILVLMGGTSSEREVSLRSGAAVADALRSKNYTVITGDPAQGVAVPPGTDAVFLALHGAGGEDGQLQGILETAGVPYVGTDATASSLCFDKWRYRQAVAAEGIDVAEGVMVTADSFATASLASKPYVLKPADGGSSLDTFIVRDPAQADQRAIADSFTRHSRMLLEELIEGIEITVAVLGDTVLPSVEIIPPSDGEFDYENKYNGKTVELCPSPSLTAEQEQLAGEIALQCHTITGCRDLSRTDMMVTPEGRIVVLETNTLPGMTDQSLFPKAAAAAGIPFADLADRLVQMALARKSLPV
jgi:D-alanine-D-alanine ligase